MKAWLGEVNTSIAKGNPNSQTHVRLKLSCASPYRFDWIMIRCPTVARSHHLAPSRFSACL